MFLAVENYELYMNLKSLVKDLPKRAVMKSHQKKQ